MLVKSEFPELNRTVTLDGVEELSKKLDQLTRDLRKDILTPNPRKHAPTFTSTQLAEMCGIDRARLHYLATREGSTLPVGEVQGNGRSRNFSLAEVRAWVQQVAPIKRSPLIEKGEAEGRIVVTSNFKGGSCKTTTTMCIAQGLSLRGRRVLLVDLDPQASLTELCGLYAEKMLGEDDTVLPFIYQPNEARLEDVVQPTYWDGIDVIPAHPTLFAAEFWIPSQVKTVKGYKFWSILRDGLAPLRGKYDYIILDTAPSLSYLTINGLMAADSMVMPLVPESLDFISSVSFWSLFNDMTPAFREGGDSDKKFDFVSVLLSRVDNSSTSSAPIVRSWVQAAYGHWMSQTEVPASSVMSTGAVGLSTVFDVSKWEGGNKTLARIREPLEEYCRWMDDFYANKWGTAE
ncbi:AAA family ATPase [Paraburkholderia sp. MMS20-SJTR3]|uniref:AAA family ATPase n=1 Tax=Paraburkholderia sejongensis TaxID=2886946 RepID=A0ABS8K5S3_9BURK|nr:AAA family ATPase [Paraburkholderia sp. MMS20-SJTR3]MCC8397475.1 AAA family ATPase [Paraburkholderia sp. MMS20-SJTR3]